MNIYFDNAATSHPKPQAVIDEVLRALSEYNANPGRSGHAAALEAARSVFSARNALMQMLHAPDDSCIAFCANCTDALNLAIKGVLHRGDHVISTLLEHNSVLRPLSTLSSRRQIALTLIAPEADGMVQPDAIARAIRNNTRLIVVTHASNVTGAIQPVAAIGDVARRHGICYLIDGAQVLGMQPVNVERLHCDLYAFPGHKSLLGPQGTGGLFIRKGLTLTPLREGGTGTESDSMLQPDDPPERYESGTVNLPGISGLRRGVEYVQENQSSIMMHERELTSALMDGLSAMQEVVLYSPREEAARAGIVCFNAGDLSSSELADALSRRGIAVRGGLHCAPGAHRFLGTLQRGAVRASVSWANSFDEVDLFLRAVRSILKNGA